MKAAGIQKNEKQNENSRNDMHMQPEAPAHTGIFIEKR